MPHSKVKILKKLNNYTSPKRGENVNEYTSGENSLNNDNIVLENALLGFILIDHEKLAGIMDILPDSSCFTAPTNKNIYDVFTTLYRENKFPGSAALVIEELVQSTKAPMFDNYEKASRYINMLLDAPTIEATKYNPDAYLDYAEKIKWNHDRNSIARFGRTLSEKASAIAFSERDEYVSRIENELSDLTMGVHGKEGLKHISQITSTLEEQISQLRRGEQLSSGVATGLDNLDKVLNGLKGGEVCVLAGRPALGKTTLSLQIAYNVAKQPPASNGKRKAVLIFSLEMMEDQLTSRLVANIGRVNMQNFMSDYKHYVEGYYKENYSDNFNNLIKEKLDEQYSRYHIALQESKKLPIYPTTESSLSPNAIRSMVMQKVNELERNGEELGLIVIDYLQLMVPVMTKANSSRTEEVGDMSRKMKILAKDFDVPVLLLAQLNRNANVTERPNLKDLRESGSIEQDADKVIFIWSLNADKSASDFHEYRDEAAQREALRKEQMKVMITVAKNRQGECADCQVIFDKGFQTFISQSDSYSSNGETFDDFADKYYQKTRTTDIFWPLKQGEIPEELESHRQTVIRETPYLSSDGTLHTIQSQQDIDKNKGMRVSSTVTDAAVSAATTAYNNNTQNGHYNGKIEYDNTKPSRMPDLYAEDETDYTSGFEDLDDEELDLEAELEDDIVVDEYYDEDTEVDDNYETDDDEDEELDLDAYEELINNINENG